MRRLIMGRLRNAGIARIETERSSNAQMTVTIHTAKPGIVIGKGGASVDQLREDLEKRFGNRVRISIQEIKQPELDAQLVAENIASQIERRISHRRAMKQSILRTMRAGAKGVRVALAGRLRGSEMARREQDREGRVPLHTLRADIRFGRATAKTTFGMIGVKCWIYRDLYAAKTRRGEAPEEGAAQGPESGQSGGPAGGAGAERGAGPRRRPPRTAGGPGGPGGGRPPQQASSGGPRSRPQQQQQAQPQAQPPEQPPSPAPETSGPAPETSGSAPETSSPAPETSSPAPETSELPTILVEPPDPGPDLSREAP